MARRAWWSGTLADKLVLIQNFVEKISTVGPELGLTGEQIKDAIALCNAIIGAFNATEQCKTAMVAMTTWRDEVFLGEPMGNPASVAPVFPVVGAVTYTRGTVTQFMALRELIVALPAYTMSYGEELGIVGAEVTPRSVVDMAPIFKKVSASGVTVSVVGSMQGFDAMRVEYAPKGGDFTTIAFLTNTPGSFNVPTANPNIAETGQIRGIFIKKNEEIGRYSANYPVTLA